MSTNVSHNEADSRYELTVDDRYLALVPAERRAQFGLPTA
jgi:hypothetical protein